MKAPLITVLMPVYNAETHLREAIESILNQTYRDFELLIINDGSTDSSEDIILNFNDKRIRYIENETNLKLIATLNKGIELSGAKYIVRMDADDISVPERLQTQLDFMETNPDVAICGSWFQIFGEHNTTVKYVGTHNEIMMKMLYQCHLCHPSVIVRKSMIAGFPVKFDPRFLHAEDYDFFSRVGLNFKLANIQKVLLKYRSHTGSVSVQNKQTQIINSIIVRRQLFEKIGLHIADDELELFRTISQHEYARTEEYLSRSQLLLEKMVVANKTGRYLDDSFFKNYISQLWYNVTYSLTPLGMMSFKRYFSSNLGSFNLSRFFSVMKFWIKAVLKI